MVSGTLTNGALEASGFNQGLAFDQYDVLGECKTLLRRMQLVIKATPDLDRDVVNRWRWDICEFIEESLSQLHRIWDANKEGSPSLVILDEIRSTLDSVKLGLGLPQGFRQCLEDMIKQQRAWREDFHQEFGSLLDDSRQTHDTLHFQDVTSSKGGFFDSRVSARDIELLVRRHYQLHLKAGKLRRQLELCHRALRQSGVAHGRRTLAERSVGDKLTSTVASLAAAAVMPLPGAMEAWAVSTGMLWLSADAAWRHVVYEHPEDTTVEMIAEQFDLPENSRALVQLRDWIKGDAESKTGKVLIHNAAVRKLNVTVTLFSCIDGKQDGEQNKNVFKQALENHPLGKVAQAVFKPGDKEEKVNEGVVKTTVEPTRATILNLPKLHDYNLAWRADFSYGDEKGDDSKVGECRLHDGLLVSFVSVDCGVRIHDGAADVLPDATLVPAEPKGNRTQAVGFMNRCFDTVTVKIFDGADKNLIRHPVVEQEVRPQDALLADAEAKLRLIQQEKKKKDNKDEAKEEAEESGAQEDTSAKQDEPGPKRWDIEIFFGGFPPRKTQCEVTSCQIVYIDGVLEGGS